MYSWPGFISDRTFNTATIIIHMATETTQDLYPYFYYWLSKFLIFLKDAHMYYQY